MALKPIWRSGLGSSDFCDHHAGGERRWAIPGVASMDILGNVVPFIKNEEEKMEAETLKLLGGWNGQTAWNSAGGEDDGALQSRGGGRRAHGERVDEAGEEGDATRKMILAAWAEFKPLAGLGLPTAPAQPVEFTAAEGSTAASAGSQSRQGHGGDGGTAAAVRACWTGSLCAVAQHRARRSGSRDFERGAAGSLGKLDPRWQCRHEIMNLVVMKFGGTSVEDAAAILRTAAIVAGARGQGQAARGGGERHGQGDGPAAARGDCGGAQGIAPQRWPSARGCGSRHRDTATQLVGPALREDPLARCGRTRGWPRSTRGWKFDALEEVLRGLAVIGELTPRISDMIVSYGERVSSRIVAEAFRECGHEGGACGRARSSS
jgi:hypothetical protein